MSSSFIFTFMMTVFVVLVAQVHQTSSKSVDATTVKNFYGDNEVRLHNDDKNNKKIDKRDATEVVEGRAKQKYSYYYIGRSVLYFVLYYQLFYNFYFLAHIVRSAFLHRVSQPPGHLQYYRDKVLPPLLGNLVSERWPLYNSKRAFQANNEQLEPTYEINQEGIHKLTMTVLNAIKKFSGDYNNAS